MRADWACLLEQLGRRAILAALLTAATSGALIGATREAWRTRTPTKETT